MLTPRVHAVTSRMTLRRRWFIGACRSLATLAVLCGPSLGDLLADEPAPAPNAADDAPLVVVNGIPIRRSDLEFLHLARRIPEARRDELRPRLIEELIDQQLVRAFLASRQTEAPPEEIDARLRALRGLIEQDGQSPEAVLQKLGLTEELLRRALALPLAWSQHVRRVTTVAQVEERFASHRFRYDGTQFRVSQIVRTLPADAAEEQRQAARLLLDRLRGEIVAGTIAFAAAAREQSQSPSAEQGGDVGWASYGTRLPRELIDAVGRSKVGEVSPVVETRYGLHLLTVTDIRPGELSLEDVRGEVLADLGQQLWNELVASQRAQSKIVRSAP